MSLYLTNCNPPSQNSYVKYIVNEIEENPKLFIYISRIFDQYRVNQKDLMDQIKNAVFQILNNPRLILTEEKRSEIITTMVKIYEQRKFSEIRSDILEWVIAEFGPFSIECSHFTHYFEPKIIDKENNSLVGESERRCDVVFYENDFKEIEFIECKSNIASVIPENLPFNHSKFKKDNREKVIYLNAAYRYLKAKGMEPSIYFACFNNNYEYQLENVKKNWGFSHINFINPQEVYNCVCKRN